MICYIYVIHRALNNQLTVENRCTFNYRTLIETSHQRYGAHRLIRWIRQPLSSQVMAYLSHDLGFILSQVINEHKVNSNQPNDKQSVCMCLQSEIETDLSSVYFILSIYSAPYISYYSEPRHPLVCLPTIRVILLQPVQQC